MPVKLSQTKPSLIPFINGKTLSDESWLGTMWSLYKSICVIMTVNSCNPARRMAENNMLMPHPFFNSLQKGGPRPVDGWVPMSLSLPMGDVR